MLNKTLIKKNFEKNISKYDDNAFVQKKMAQRLCELIKGKNYAKILEIGSYSGVLTKKINEVINFERYLALDIIDCSSYIKKINPEIEFKNIDIDDFKTDEKFDLIISNAALQWSGDFKKTVKKLKSYLKKEGTIALSFFSNKNLYQIKDIFNTGLEYLSDEEIKGLFSADAYFEKKEENLVFQNGLEILKHLKYTGVNSIKENTLSYLEIKKKLELFKKKYNNTLTYSSIYVIERN